MLSKSIVSGKCFWNGKKITKSEYDKILAIIRNKPTAPEGYGYKLNDYLEWELYELPVVEESTEELSETEQKAMGYDIIVGVSE